MCPGGVVEAEAAALRIGELLRVDRRSHQAARRMRLRAQQVVTDLVRHGAAEHEPQAVIDLVRPFEQLEPLCILDDPAGAGDRRDATANGGAPSVCTNSPTVSVAGPPARGTSRAMISTLSDPAISGSGGGSYRSMVRQRRLR